MDNKIVLALVALFIPPLAVYLKNNKIDNEFWLNLVLTFFGGIPGMLHAWYLIFTK